MDQKEERCYVEVLGCFSRCLLPQHNQFRGMVLEPFDLCAEFVSA